MIDLAEVDARADGLVRALYRELATEKLREMAEIGKKYEAIAEKEGRTIVLAVNAALQREIERRDHVWAASQR